jgi:hypothetical protein
VWALSAAPAQTVVYLGTHLKPARRLDPKHMSRLVADLDNTRFAVRTAASRALEHLGTQAEAALKDALRGRLSPEARRQIEALVAKLTAIVNDPELLRAIRAVLVLERIATPEARRLLKQLAEGAPDTRLTQEAKRALDRLGLRGKARQEPRPPKTGHDP